MTVGNDDRLRDIDRFIVFQSDISPANVFALLFIKIYTMKILIDIADRIDIKAMTIKMSEPEVLQAQIEYQAKSRDLLGQTKG